MALDKTLRSIYLRLDVGMKHLTSNAIGQIIVKLLYANGCLKRHEINEAIAKVNASRHIDASKIDNILDSLVPKEIKLNHGSYSLSSAKREQIKKQLDESNQRKELIIDRYFNRLNSERDSISEWLTDVSIKFFEAFSDEWISDLVGHTSYVIRNESAIRELITNRTKSFANIDTEDKKVLPQRFFDFVNSKDTNVNDYLWEYGTSAFASILITNEHGVDQLTLDTFKDSVCILDTNILLFIALESRFKDALAALEKVFRDLNIKIKILYITKKEYEGKIHWQRDITLHNLDKYGYDIVSSADDDFTKCALLRRCKTKEDFESFFDYTLSLPKQVKESVSIDILDDDKGLVQVIDDAQKDESLVVKLVNIIKSISSKKKGESAIIHDVGLLEGVKFLRKKGTEKGEKYFILSEDKSVNQYSKSTGFSMGLPLSLRVDTLINMLAVNNGGDTFEASDYKGLFANLIRMELFPNKETFRQTELYDLYKKNSRIANLPKDTVKEIAIEMHHKSLDGVDEANLLRDLNEYVTKGELKLNDELVKVKNDLFESDKENQRLSVQHKNVLGALESTIRNKVSAEYDKETKELKRKYWMKKPLVFGFLAFIILAFIFYGQLGASAIESFLVSIIASVVVAIISKHGEDKAFIRKRIEDRDRYIVNETDRRLKNKLSKGTNGIDE